jgi:hypothetical protein
VLFSHAVGSGAEHEHDAPSLDAIAIWVPNVRPAELTAAPLPSR